MNYLRIFIDFMNGLGRPKKVYKNIDDYYFSKSLYKKGHSLNLRNLLNNWHLTTPNISRGTQSSHLQFDMYTSIQNIGRSILMEFLKWQLNF